MAKQKYEKFGSRNFHPEGIGDTVGNAEGDLMFFGGTSVDAGRVYILTTQACEGEDLTLEDCAQWVTADADNSNNENLIAVATGTGNANAVGMLLRGMVTMTSGFATNSVCGAPVYVSDSAGVLTTTVPSGSADYVRKVGHVIGQNKMWFNPDNTIIKTA